MDGALLLYITIDHYLIVEWAKRRDAHPSTFEGDERPWPLYFGFGPCSAGLEEISWDRFFTEFEGANLAFVFRDAGPNGELDDLHTFVKRAAVPELVTSGRSTIIERVL